MTQQAESARWTFTQGEDSYGDHQWRWGRWSDGPFDHGLIIVHDDGSVRMEMYDSARRVPRDVYTRFMQFVREEWERQDEARSDEHADTRADRLARIFEANHEGEVR